MTDIEIKKKISEISYLDNFQQKLVFHDITNKNWEDVVAKNEPVVKRYSVTIYNKLNPSEKKVITVSAMDRSLAERYAIKNGCMIGWEVLKSRKVTKR